MRYGSVILLMSAAVASAASGPPIAEASAQWEKDGRSLFFACEFKRPAHAFEKAVVDQPERAVLHFWLGKSYARLAEVSSPLTARKMPAKHGAAPNERSKSIPKMTSTGGNWSTFT